MERNSVGLLIFAAMISVVFLMEMTTVVLPGSPVAAWMAGLAAGTVFALLIRVRLNREFGKLQQSVDELQGGTDVKLKRTLLEFESTAASLHTASQKIRGTLRAADEDKEKLEALLDSMQDAVVAVDGSGRIQWTNQRMQRLLPGGAGWVSGGGAVRLGRALVQTIRDPDVLECVKLALENGSVTVRRSTSMMPGRIFEVNASPMPGGGAVAVLHDVTRIEEVERTQRDFVANVSHELRTPLTSITGYVETLLDHEQLSQEAREFLNTILKNATRMNRLTEDLLVMARVESPTGEMHPAPVPANELVQDAVEAMTGMVQENGGTLELGPVTQAQVFADSDAVMQVLGNLIENAVKYGTPRGVGAARLILSAREVTEPYAAVEFSVRDFGAGIALEHQSRIFERFYRVDKTRSRESGGTGLGLSIARHIVQTQGGSIWVDSELGQGSTFHFTLPKALYPVASVLA